MCCWRCDPHSKVFLLVHSLSSFIEPSKVVTPRLTTQAVDYTSITWDAPSEQNGELETYRIDFEGKTVSSYHIF